MSVPSQCRGEPPGAIAAAEIELLLLLLGYLCLLDIAKRYKMLDNVSPGFRSKCENVGLPVRLLVDGLGLDGGGGVEVLEEVLRVARDGDDVEDEALGPTEALHLVLVDVDRPQREVVEGALRRLGLQVVVRGRLGKIEIIQ